MFISSLWRLGSMTRQLTNNKVKVQHGQSYSEVTARTKARQVKTSAKVKAAKPVTKIQSKIRPIKTTGGK